MRVTVTMLAGLLACSAFAEDVRPHLILDWTPQAPTTDGAPLAQADLYDRINGFEPQTINNVTKDRTLDDGTVCVADPIRIVTDGVVTSATLRTAKTVPFLRMPQPDYTDASGNIHLANHKVVFPGASVKPLREATVFLRMRWGGLVAGADRSDIFGYDHNWNANSGFSLSIDKWGQPAVAIGGMNPKVIGELWLKEGVWMDLAYTIKEVVDGGGVASYQIAAYRCRTDADSGSVSYRSNTITGRTLQYRAEGSRKIEISTQDSTAFGAVGQYYRNFRGDIQRIAVYDKAFTADEMDQIMSGDSVDFSLGVQNGSAAEFFDAAATADFDCETMPWRKLKANLTAENPTLTLRKNLPETTAANARLLRFGIVGDAGRSADRAYLRLIVNGKKLGSVKVEQTNGTYLVCLPEKLMAEKVVKVGDDYPLELTLERIGDKRGNLAFDSITLGGTWQIGVWDMDNAEFGGYDTLNHRYSVVANNAKLLMGSLYGNNGGSSYNPDYIYFTVEPEIAANFEAKFLIRVKEGSRWKLMLNGVDYFTNFWEADADTKTTYEVTFPAGTLRAGQNELVFRVPDVSKWTKPDAFGLKLTEQQPCSLVPFPYGGLVLLFK